MNNKLSSVVAALSLMASAVLPACSETGLSLAPERQTLPAPEIELTSVGVRGCIAKMFRALETPAVLCPSPLSGIEEEAAADALFQHETCIESVPIFKETMYVGINNVFLPHVGEDFDTTLDRENEIQEAIAVEDIPLTLVFKKERETFDSPTVRINYGLLIIPGFIEDSEELRGFNLPSDVSTLNIHQVQLASSETFFLQEAGHYARGILGTYFTVFEYGSSPYSMRLRGSMYGESSGASEHFDLGLKAPGFSEYPMFNESTSDILAASLANNGLLDCIKDEVKRVQSEEGTSVWHIAD